MLENYNSKKAEFYRAEKDLYMLQEIINKHLISWKEYLNLSNYFFGIFNQSQQLNLMGFDVATWQANLNLSTQAYIQGQYNYLLANNEYNQWQLASNNFNAAMKNYNDIIMQLGTNPSEIQAIIEDVTSELSKINTSISRSFNKTQHLGLFQHRLKERQEFIPPATQSQFPMMPLPTQLQPSENNTASVIDSGNQISQSNDEIVLLKQKDVLLQFRVRTLNIWLSTILLNSTPSISLRN